MTRPKFHRIWGVFLFAHGGQALLQRGGEVAIKMLADIRQKTIKPLILATVAPGTMVYTDEHDIYARLLEWGYGPQDGVPQRCGVRP